jgi:cytochrome P450
LADDPYVLYALLRDKGVVRRVGEGASPAGAPAVWLVSGHAEVSQALRDTRLSSAGPMRQRGRSAAGSAFGVSMVSVDPPEHTRLRGIVSKAFTPRRVTNLRPRIAEIVDELLADVPPGSTFDLMETFAGPLPAIVIAELLGVPREDQERFRAWSNALFDVGFDALQRGPDQRPAGVGELVRYLGEIIDARRAEPADDLLSAMVTAQAEGASLSDAELRATALLLLIAGFETTTNLIGNGTLALLRNEAECARLRADRTLLPSAIEELLRYDSPVQLLTRTVVEPVELGGERIEAPAAVVLLVGAANRDPRVFADPDRLDIGRAKNPHVSFGWGIHHCLGAPLARLEAEVAFTGLLDRYPRFVLGDGGISHRPNPMLRGLSHLSLATST